MELPAVGEIGTSLITEHKDPTAYEWEHLGTECSTHFPADLT